jgi:hypothetical protein
MRPSSLFSRSMNETKRQTLERMQSKGVAIHSYNGMKGT